MIELQGRHVAVVGLGESGLAMARWVARHGARVTVLDDRDAPPQAAALAADVPAARLIRGPLSFGAIDGSGDGAAVDLLAWSPGLSPLAGPAAALHQAAVAARLPVHGELDFFAAELARRAALGYRPTVIAITGTNGKTTVTRLAGHLAGEAGLDAQTAGNIGPAMLDALRDRIDADRLPQMWVLELSSFQLALAGRFDCSASVVLNVTQDHLDWHLTMAHYQASKLRVHRGSACCLVNLDDPLTDPAAAGPESDSSPAGIPARAARASKARKPAPAPIAHAGFTLAEPAAAPAFGVVRDGGLAWLVEALPDDDAPSRRRRTTPGVFRLNRLMPADALRLHGSHNHANVLAALALLRAAGLPMAPMLRGLQDFEPGPHRCTRIAVVHEVEYYDDSKGTNVGATIAALSGLGRRCVLIAGGLGKGQDFAPLGPVVRRHARAVVLIGRDAPLLRAALEDTGVPLSDAATMEDAVRAAADLARPGDAVLMSPACASFDMFRGYPHRAEVYITAVRRVAEEAGQPC